jgi:hypothetical protein
MLSVVFNCIKKTLLAERKRWRYYSPKDEKGQKKMINGMSIVKICGGEIVVRKERTQLMDSTNFRNMGMLWLSKI